MNTKPLLSKPAIGAYVTIAIIVASVFGLQQSACDLAKMFDIKSDACEVEVVVEE